MWTADALVIFGATGDLAHRMTFPALYRLERRGLLNCPVVGVARSELTTAQFADRVRKAVQDSNVPMADSTLERPADRLAYVSGDVTDPSLYGRPRYVEECWRILQPLLTYPPPVHTYPAGSWGPPQAEALVAAHFPWRRPWVPR